MTKPFMMLTSDGSFVANSVDDLLARGDLSEFPTCSSDTVRLLAEAAMTGTRPDYRKISDAELCDALSLFAKLEHSIHDRKLHAYLETIELPEGYTPTTACVVLDSFGVPMDDLELQMRVLCLPDVLSDVKAAFAAHENRVVIEEALGALRRVMVGVIAADELSK